MSAEKFRELAERRVNNAIKQMRLVGNLANPNVYEYSDDQVKAITAALKSELDRLQARFKTSGNGSAEQPFKL